MNQEQVQKVKEVLEQLEAEIKNIDVKSVKEAARVIEMWASNMSTISKVLDNITIVECAGYDYITCKIGNLDGMSVSIEVTKSVTLEEIRAKLTEKLISNFQEVLRRMAYDIKTALYTVADDLRILADTNERLFEVKEELERLERDP